MTGKKLTYAQRRVLRRVEAGARIEDRGPDGYWLIDGSYEMRLQQRVFHALYHDNNLLVAVPTYGARRP